MIKGVGIVAGTKDDVELIEFLFSIIYDWGLKKAHHGLQLYRRTKEVLQKYINHPNVDIILSAKQTIGIPQLHRWLTTSEPI